VVNAPPFEQTFTVEQGDETVSIQNQAEPDPIMNHAIRYAFKMKLKPGCIVEYKRRHDEIWPKLASELKAAGISDYSIFFDETTHTLFAVQKLDDHNSAAVLPYSLIVRNWWDYMAPLMEVNPDHSPVVGPLTEVFHLE
jgi:L-rhamnose mutarotase